MNLAVIEFPGKYPIEITNMLRRAGVDLNTKLKSKENKKYI